MRTTYVGVLDDVAAGLGPTFASRRAKSFPMGEDTQIMELLQARGAGAIYVSGAAVQHQVRGFQTELDFMLARAERHGRGFAIRNVEQAGRGFPRKLARRVRTALAHFMRRRKYADPSSANAQAPSPEAFERLWTAHWEEGAWRGAAFGPFPKKPA
jgi:hypothetical protein